jgi:hypothetical protein
MLYAALNGDLPGGLFRADDAPNLAMKNLVVDGQLFASIWQAKVPWGLRLEPGRDYCSGLEVEERLSIFPRDVHRLLATNHLDQIPNTTLFSRTRVLEIAQSFISSTEIAARSGVPTTSVKAWARSRGIERLEDNFPLWCREDTEAFLPRTSIGWEAHVKKWVNGKPFVEPEEEPGLPSTTVAPPDTESMPIFRITPGSSKEIWGDSAPCKKFPGRGNSECGR